MHGTSTCGYSPVIALTLNKMLKYCNIIKNTFSPDFLPYTPLNLTWMYFWSRMLLMAILYDNDGENGWLTSTLGLVIIRAGGGGSRTPLGRTTPFNVSIARVRGVKDAERQLNIVRGGCNWYIMVGKSDNVAWMTQLLYRTLKWSETTLPLKHLLLSTLIY